MEFTLNASLQTSPLESNVENSAFVSSVRLFFNRLKSTFPHLSFKDLKPRHLMVVVNLWCVAVTLILLHY